MAINISDVTFTWQFNPLSCYPTASGYSDVVASVFYQLTGRINGTSVTSGGHQEMLPLSPSSSFIPFENLSSTTVQGWVEDALGEEAITNLKNDIVVKLEDKVNPPIVRKQSPWILS